MGFNRVAFKLNKQHINTLDTFVRQVEGLMEDIATDPQTEHLLDQAIEDNFYTVRYIVEELVKSANGDSE